jgi:hypothetical protein
MEQIKILIYTSRISGLSDAQWHSRVSILEKLSVFCENEINRSGGIYNKPVKLILKVFQETGDPAYNLLVNHLNENDDYSVVVCAAPKKRVDELFKIVDFKKFLYFSANSTILPQDEQKPYFFNVSRVARDSKVSSALDFLKNDFKGDSIYFLHEGKRYKDDLLPLLNTIKNPVIDHDVSQIKAENYNFELNPLIKDISDNDLLILDISALKTIHVINFFNDNKNSPTVLKLYGLIDARVDEYNFPIIEIASKREMPISFQLLCDQIDKNLTHEEKDYIANGIFRVEVPFLLAYASRNSKKSICNKEDLFSALREDINKIDGINDFYIGKACVYSFKDNNNTNKTSYNHLIPKSLQKDGQIHRISYPTQFLPYKNEIVKFKVNYIYIDLIRITKIDIGESIWSCEFYMDINSIHPNPLDFIQFNNLSLINSKFETKLIKQSKDKKFGSTNFRYYIVSNFDFFAIADNYPFDWQHIYISMSIPDQDKYGILQPIPETLLDKEFRLDGWKIKDAKTGTLVRKERHHEDSDLVRCVELREDIRIGWTVARNNSVTMTKVAFPIIFLFFLNYYTTFLPFKDSNISLGILTTIFLSGIAFILLFSGRNNCSNYRLSGTY